MDNLYREELMEIYKHPQNRGKMQNPSVEVVKKNPICGDELGLQLKVEDGVIKDAKFEGLGCAVSVISSEILMENLIGKTVSEAAAISKEDLLNMLGMNLSTSRVKCATLILDALENAIKETSRKN
jgi:nitrogen fixation NifU-like protein